MAAAAQLREEVRARTARRPDRLAGFSPLVISVRWGTVALGLSLAALGDDSSRNLAYGIPLVAYAAMRTIRPLRYLSDRVSSVVVVLAEVALSLYVVVATGYWDSPYLFCVAAAIIAAGLAEGFGFAIRTAVTVVLAVALPYHRVVEGANFLVTIQWGGELLLIAIVAGYARRLFGEAEERNLLARQANELLAELHDVAQTLPASLDLQETVRTTIAQLRDTVTFDAVAILLREPGPSWAVAGVEGIRLPTSLLEPELPELARAVANGQPAVVTQSAGLLSGARSAIYAPFIARGRVIGLLAVESSEALTRRDLEFVDGVAKTAAIAVDNARWFTRLRTVGADEERTRIARDLHDRVGQSLAFVAFELDRIGRRADGGAVQPELLQLREEVRKVVTEVRDTLHDLRTDVSERQDLVMTMEDFLGRVGTRAALGVRFSSDATARLPLRQEREMWRIAQEAITNSWRHAEASTIDVAWKCDAQGAVLEVRDDGRGIADGADRQLGSYGILGMRERAAAIGATLELAQAETGGTIVRCRLLARAQ